MSELDQKAPCGHFRDAEGCLYVAMGVAKSSDDASPQVVFQHLWPFAPVVLVEPLAGWHERYIPVADKSRHASKGMAAAARASVAPARAQLLRSRALETVNVAYGRYRHTDGGIYRVSGFALDPAGGVRVLYRHLWPFESQMWARPLQEWPARFTLMTEGEFVRTTAGERQQAQEAVRASRMLRKGTAGP